MCLECHKEGDYVCKKCLAKVARAAPVCPQCQKPSIDGMTHFACKRKLGIDGLTSVWLYEGVVRRAILAMKYRFAREIARELVIQALVRLKTQKPPFPNGAILTPIPLHRLRYNWRGFNQSEEMGKLIAKSLSLKFVPDLLLRKKSKTPQTELTGKQRLKNIKDVFSLNPNQLVPSASCFVLFDDVFTTGSTLKEATKVLKRGGVGTVWGLTIAR